MTNRYYHLVRTYMLELGFELRHQQESSCLLVVSKPELGIENLVLSCGDPLLILEQYLLELRGVPGAAAEKPRHYSRRFRAG